MRRLFTFEFPRKICDAITSIDAMRDGHDPGRAGAGAFDPESTS